MTAASQPDADASDLPTDHCEPPSEHQLACQASKMDSQAQCVCRMQGLSSHRSNGPGCTSMVSGIQACALTASQIDVLVPLTCLHLAGCRSTAQLTIYDLLEHGSHRAAALAFTWTTQGSREWPASAIGQQHDSKLQSIRSIYVPFCWQPISLRLRASSQYRESTQV